VKGRVQNLSLSKKEDLQSEQVFALNGIERTADVQALHVGRSAAGYYADARGKNGEPLAGEPLSCFFKHRWFRAEVHVELQTDAQGRAQLGALDGIERLHIQASAGQELAGCRPATCARILPPFTGRRGRRCACRWPHWEKMRWRASRCWRRGRGTSSKTGGRHLRRRTAFWRSAGCPLATIRSTSRARRARFRCA
jgi:hypothetical protein